MASDMEAVLFGGDGTFSIAWDSIALADRFLVPGLRGERPGEGIMGSSTGGSGDSEVGFSRSCCCPVVLFFGGLPGFLGGVLVAPGEWSLTASFLKAPFLLNKTAVRRLTPRGGVAGADCSVRVFEEASGLEGVPSVVGLSSLAPGSDSDSLLVLIRPLPRPLPRPRPLPGKPLPLAA